jgi:hypothetical protein
MDPVPDPGGPKTRGSGGSQIRNTDFYKYLLIKMRRKRIRKTSLTIHSGIPTEAGNEVRNILFRTV